MIKSLVISLLQSEYRRISLEFSHELGFQREKRMEIDDLQEEMNVSRDLNSLADINLLVRFVDEFHLHKLRVQRNLPIYRITIRLFV